MKHLLTMARQTTLRIPWTPAACCAAALLLTAAVSGGQYAPWALAAVAAAGVGWRGLATTVCAGLGALAFMDFQPGLRHAAAAVLIYCANTALCTTRLYTRPRFRPAAACCAAALTQFPYLIGRSGREWALCAASLALLYGCALLLPALLPDTQARQDDRRRALFLLLLGVCASLARWPVMGFAPSAVLASAVVLVFAGDAQPTEAAAAGALAGITLDLCGSELYMTAVLCAGAASAAFLRRLPRLAAAVGFCAASVLAALLLGEVRPLAPLCQAVTAAGLWLLLPPSVHRRLPPAPEPEGEAAPAAAFRAVYDSLAADIPSLRPENPAVLFDRAAERVCRDCALRADCWQSHYADTYNAFNDACPALLRRGRALAEDFPPHFSLRCIRFPQLLAALDGQLHDYLQRRFQHARLDAAYRLAREQYRQVSEVLACPAAAKARRAQLTCRTAAVLRPKTGEKLCGDQYAIFHTGTNVCLALSDGMGSGESAHREAGMTVRLLQQFLCAGIRPQPALKTLNTAAMLRCQSGGGFTTIDLACFDRAAGTLTLYKYGAAPSYIKRHGTVVRCAGQALPAGLESADGNVPPQTLPVSQGTWLVQVSDGVAGEDDEWLQDLLAGWDGTSPQALAQELLRQSQQRTGGSDDCAVLVLAVEGREDAHPV